MKRRMHPWEREPGDMKDANTAPARVIGQEVSAARTARYEAVFNQSARDLLAICRDRPQTPDLVDCQTESATAVQGANRNHCVTRVAEKVGRLMRAAVSLCRQAYQLVAL